MQVSQEKLFGIKLEQELHRMEAALHACLHLGSSITNIRPVSSQRSGPQPPQPGWNTEVAADPFPPGEDAEVPQSKGDSGDKWLPGKQTDLPTPKEACLWVPYTCSSPQCSMLGQLWATVWAEMTSWPCPTVWVCRGAPAPAGHGAQQVLSSSPAETETLQGWDIKTHEDEIWRHKILEESIHF